jgi:F0F1-type ATP synthase beta subunit
VQVIQRPGGGLVRGVTTSPLDGLPRGSTVLSSGRLTDTEISPEAFASAVRLLARPPSENVDTGRLLETGIKVIDVICPLVACGTVAIAGAPGTGIGVFMEEITRRLSSSADRLSIFILIPGWPGEREPGFSHADALKKDGYSEGTRGGVQTFFLRADDAPWTPDRLAGLAPVDVVVHLTSEVAHCNLHYGIWPCVDVRTSRSRLLETKMVGDEHAVIADRAKQTLTLLLDPALAETADPSIILRARKLANFFAQPFFCTEPWTKRPGSHVSLKDSLQGCREILDGVHDDLPVEAFHFTGSMDEIRAARPG